MGSFDKASSGTGARLILSARKICAGPKYLFFAAPACTGCHCQSPEKQVDKMLMSVKILTMSQWSPASAGNNPFRKQNQILGIDNSSYISTSHSLARAVAQSESGIYRIGAHRTIAGY